MTSSPLTPEQALQAARRGTGGPFSFCPPAWQAAENPWIPRFSAVFASLIHRKNVCSERLILDGRTFLWQRFLACVWGRHSDAGKMQCGTQVGAGERHQARKSAV